MGEDENNGSGAAALALIGALGGSLINFAGNRELSEEEFNRYRMLINEQNEYNTPKSQLQRYVDAGLNPNLIYGNGQSSAGNQSQIAQYHRPEFSIGDTFLQALKMGYDLQLLKKEIDLKDAQIDNTREQQFNIRSNRMGIDMDNAFKSALLDYNPGVLLMPQELDSIRQSKMFKKYSSEAAGVDIANTLKEAQTKLANFNAEHQKNIVREFDKYQSQILSAQAAGLNIENEIKGIERDLQKRLDSIGGKSGAKLIIDVLRELLSLRH